jgi:3',5'-cyclic AMP phosphodiesterase CpdA
MYRKLSPLLPLVLLLAGWVSAAEQEKPLVTFGVVADVQYADKDTSGARRYRESVPKLAGAVAEWTKEGLAFVVELGDLTDDRGPQTEKDVAKVLETLKSLRAPLYHVLGNHGLPSLGREKLLQALGLPKPYYDFAQGGWRFVVLDGMGLSLGGWPAESERLKAAKAYLQANQKGNRPELVQWNGAIDDEQKKWLEEALAKAAKDGERVVVFCHHPALPEATGRGAMLWNHDEIVKILEACPAVVAYVAGHEHRGGYAFRNGIHHVTLQGLVESPADGTAFGVVSVYADKLVVRGFGALSNRTLKAREAPSGQPAEAKAR